jgi:NDP-sugar pyrophosphorylase family protein
MTTMSDRAMSRVEGLLLAGGYPWSDAAFPSLLPRPLLPVALHPLVSYPLRWLRDAGVRQVTMCVNGPGAALRRILLREGFEEPFLRYHRDETPRGPAGCLRDATRGSEAETFVVADATLIPTLDLDDVLTRHRETGAALTVVAHCAGGGRARDMATPTGIYVFDRRALDQVPDTGFHDIKENLVPKLYRSGERVVRYVAPAAGPRIFDAETYLAVNHWMIERLYAESPTLGEGTVGTGRVAASARLIGPVLLGPHVEIQAGATVVGPTAIGGYSVIGAGALVTRSVLWAHATVGSRATVDRSLLSEGARVGSGVDLFHAVRTPKPVRETVWRRLGTAWRALESMTSAPADAGTAVS